MARRAQISAGFEFPYLAHAPWNARAVVSSTPTCAKSGLVINSTIDQMNALNGRTQPRASDMHTLMPRKLRPARTPSRYIVERSLAKATEPTAGRSVAMTRETHSRGLYRPSFSQAEAASTLK